MIKQENEKIYYDVRVFDVLTIDDDQEIIWDERYDDYEKALNQYHLELDRLVEGKGVELVRYCLDDNGEQYDWEGIKGNFIYKEEGETNE